MMSNNKILTVSYGTFSCTLEGFDDSFGTMKAIAEYFRDLASEDRYFGAEPPQPDAEMLARIAEKEIARRVEAHFEDGGYVLRAGSSAPAALAAAGMAAAGADLAEEPTPEAEEVSLEDTADEPIAAEEEPFDGDDVEEAVDVVDVDLDADPQSDVDVALDGEADDTDALISSVAAASMDDEAEAPADVEDQLSDDAEDFFAQAQDDEDDVEMVTTAEHVMPSEPPADDSIAAKLQRIRDVVSRNEPEVTGPYSEDEHATTLSDQDDEDIADSSSAAYANMGWGVEHTQTGHDNGFEAEADDEDDLDALIQSAASDDDAPESTEVNMSDLNGDNMFADAPDDINLADDTEDEVAEAEETIPPVARVIRVKRVKVEDQDTESDTTAEEAQEETTADDAQGGAEFDDVAEDLDDSDELSAEDEADLLRELAEVEAEVDGENAVEASQDDDFSSISDEEFEAELSREAEELADLPEEDEETAAARLRDASSTEDEALDRLMAEAEHQLDEPEGTSRRAAFSHLRAAVAAKIADSGLGRKNEAETEEAYRDDLADAVKPRRPVAREARSERPAARPSPLKLVAEQRIDDGAKRPESPVRPRRVATGLDISDGGNFAEYAADRGATELPELLEAAASYLSFVEGLDQFSRPQLMTKVRQVEKENFSREDGLRSFGQLLREGKIEKIKGGRFTVSQDIGYRPDGERAAG